MDWGVMHLPAGRSADDRDASYRHQTETSTPLSSRLCHGCRSGVTYQAEVCFRSAASGTLRNRQTGVMRPGTASTLAVVLAAGAGSRFLADAASAEVAEHKLLAHISVLPDESASDAPDQGDATQASARTVVEHAVAAAVAADIGPVIVITGAADLTALAFPAGVELLHNAKWQEGQATSLATAISESTARGADAVVVGLGDQPGISPDAWRAVAASTSPIAVATYAGVRGNPVRLARSVWPLLPTTGDHGARSLLRTRQDLVEAVACDGFPADIDTVEDLRRWPSS